MNGVLLFRRELFDIAPIAAHDRDAVVSAGNQNEGDASAIRRPRWVFMIGIVTGELQNVRAINVHREQLFLAGNQGDEHQALAIRRRRWVEVLRMSDLNRDR